MKNYNEETMDEIELIYTPLTRQLLINYVTTKHEESADTSEDSLIQELMWLYKNNQLSELIVCEHIYSNERLINAAQYPPTFT
ncbi:hypothetical protein [Psychroserpens burtonensis]|uniref:hypothetical protein n=1 Tax=Psychroserpens burtonensis TaxID=49278 RepID=UPI00048EEAE9|nr:hypothetical protein [Psychroserpens burtonensis]